MKHVLAISARDLRERTFVFVVAAIVAVMPFAVMLARNVGDRRAVILVGGLAGSVGVSCGLALILGTSMIGRDLTDRRLSFYFSKPVNAAAIWAGKLTAAIVTLASVFAIIFVPAYLAAGSSWPGLMSVDVAAFVRLTLGSAIVILLIAHALSTIIRSHSVLIAADAILLVLGGLALWRVVTPVLANGAVHTAMTVVKIFVVAIPLAIAAGGAWQLSRGRTDIRRNHLELSRFFWSAIGATMLAAAVYVAWILSGSPRDLINRAAIASPRGDWAVVVGQGYRRGSDFNPAFLVNARNGEWTRISAARQTGGEFTRDGKALIFVQPVVSNLRSIPRGELVVQPLDGSQGRIETGISVPAWEPVAVLSSDLRRIAVFYSQTVSVYDLRSRALLGAARVPSGDQARMFFVTPDVVRVYALRTVTNRRPEDLAIYEFDVASRRLTRTGGVPASGASLWGLSASADGSTIAVTRLGKPGNKNILIADGRTGEVRASVPGAKWAWPIAMLSNGCIAFVDLTSNSFVRIFDVNGNLVRDIPIARAPGTYTGGRVRELVPGRKLLVTIRHTIGSGAFAGGTDIAVVDIATGAIDRLERNAALFTDFMPADPRASEVHPSEYVITDAAGTLWRWNPLTGAKTKIL